MLSEIILVRRVYIAGVFVLGLIWAGLLIWGEPFVSGILGGQFFPHLGQLVRYHMTNNPDHADPAYYAPLLTAAGARALLLWIVLGGTLLLFHRRRPQLLGDFITQRDHAANLAVTRAVVFLVLFFAVDPETIRQFAERPAGLREAPNLMQWWLALFPVTGDTSAAVAWIFKLACLLAAAGVFTRVATPIAALLAVYVLGIPNYFGKINHSYHAVVWCSFVLAASPCGEALSVDAWRKGKREAPTSRRYGFPLRVIWLLLATAYFFPGAWKFVLSGWDWAFSENLKFKMYSAWLNAGYIPDWRIDHNPLLYQGMAAVSMLWEIGFPLLILFRKTRLPSLLIGLGFHWGVYTFMRIGPFATPWIYVALIDWKRLARTVQTSAQPLLDTTEESPERSTGIVGVTTLIVAVTYGALLLNSWPFSVYPTHAGIRGPTYQRLEMVTVDAEGLEREVDLTEVAPTTLQGIDFNAFGSGDIEAYCKALAAAWLSKRNRRPTAALRFYRSVRYLAPESYDAPAISRDLLFQFAP